MQCDIMWIARSLIRRVVQLQFALKTNKSAGEEKKEPGQNPGEPKLKSGSGAASRAAGGH